MMSFLNISLEAYIESVINTQEPVFDHTLLAVLLLNARPQCHVVKCQKENNII